MKSLSNIIFRWVMCVLLLSIISCSSDTTNAKRMVSVTILPQKFLAEQIAGERFAVNCVVPANSNPEAYDPTSMQLVEIDKSEAYLRVGEIGFEQVWMARLSQNSPHMKVYDTSQGIDMIENTHVHTHSDGVVHAASAVDPHTWSSPRNVRIMAHNIYRAFAELDEEGEAYYKANYERLIQHIDSVDAVVRETLAPVQGRAFAIYHPSLTYLARDYGVQQLCIENGGKENSALSLKTVIDKARQSGVEVVFVQQEFDSRHVETFARELDAEVVTINPLNYEWSNEIIDIAHAIAR